MTMRQENIKNNLIHLAYFSKNGFKMITSSPPALLDCDICLILGARKLVFSFHSFTFSKTSSYLPGKHGLSRLKTL